MLIHTRDEWRDFVAQIPHDDTPVLVEVVPGGPVERPWQIGATLRGLGFCIPLDDHTFKSAYVPLSGSSPAGDDSNVRLIGDVLTLLMQRPLFVEDAHEFTVQMVCRYNLLVPVHTDKVTAHNYLREASAPFLPPVPLTVPPDVAAQEWYDRRMLPLAVLYDEIAMLRQDIEGPHRVAYEVELHALQVLARSTAHGYAHTAMDRVHPLWRTLHESGASTVVARAPALASIPSRDRHHYPADPFYRWVEVRWPPGLFQVGTVAARCGSPWLWKTAQAEFPYTVLGELWGCDGHTAMMTFLNLTASGPDEDTFAARGRDCDPVYVKALAKVAPEWVHWGATLVEHARAHGRITSFLQRPVIVTEPRAACAADVLTTQAMLLKMLISRLYVQAAQKPDRYAGFHAVLPVHAKVAYQIDLHVPVADHARDAATCAMLFPAANMPLRAEVYMGPTWGDLTRVDDVPAVQAQAAQDLADPAQYPMVCPVCGGRARDLPTLQQHAADAHGITEFMELLKYEQPVEEG